MQRQLVMSSDHAVLQNHMVYGEHLLPGLAWLDLMYQYLESLGHAFAEWELRDLSIYVPLKVREGQSVDVFFAQAVEPDGSLAIRIEGGGDDAGHGSAGTQLYATARAYRVGAPQYNDTLDRAAMEQSKLRIASTDVYEFQQTLGLVHGDFMRVRGTVYALSDDVYVEAEVGEAARAASADVLFHPALIDGSVLCAAAGATIIVQSADGLDSRLQLPVYIGSFRASAPLRERCAVRWRSQSAHKKGGVHYSSIEFYDERGTKVAELRDLGVTAGLASQSGVGQNKSGESGARYHSEADAAAVQQVESFLLAKIAEKAGALPEGMDATMHFAASGMDSAAFMAVLQDIEKLLGQPVSPVALFEHPSVRDLAGYLVETYGAAPFQAAPAKQSAAASAAGEGAEAAAGDGPIGVGSVGSPVSAES